MKLQRYIMMRHAKADASFAGGDDLGRGITQRGRDDATKMAEQLVNKVAKVDLVLVSPSRRTLETWKVIEPYLGSKHKIIEALYLAEPEVIASTLLDYSDEAETLLLLGHNPGLHQFALGIIGTGQTNGANTNALYKGLPTSSLALFENASDASHIEDFACNAFLSPQMDD